METQIDNDMDLAEFRNEFPEVNTEVLLANLDSKEDCPNSIRFEIIESPELNSTYSKLKKIKVSWIDNNNEKIIVYKSRGEDSGKTEDAVKPMQSPGRIMYICRPPPQYEKLGWKPTFTKIPSQWLYLQNLKYCFLL